MSERIKILTIKGFKGFGNEITINFTPNAKNIVIYGENGSGKSSIMEALKILLDSSMKKINLEKYKNIFLKNDIEMNIRTTGGKDINLKTKIERLKEEKGKNDEMLVTSPEDYDDDFKMYLESIAKSTTVLSYKELMKIYDLKTDEDFYDLFVKKLMANYLIPPKKEKTLIEELEELQKLKKESPRAKKRIEKKEKTIIYEINKIFSEIKSYWNDFIKILTEDSIEVECMLEHLGTLEFKIKWNGKDISSIMNYLNEGRLNAVALGLFLAYYKKFNTSPNKLLLLDDVMIGLDMNFRLPLLEILKKYFEDDYQIIITTFDENWLNLMKNYLDNSKWEFVRLILRFTDDDSLPFIVGIEESDYLKKAKKYFENDDIPASALYTRLEFERLVSKYAEEKKLEIRFKKKISEIQINEIWTKVKQNLPNSKTLCKRIDTYKSILLNPSVHYDLKPKYRNEVKYSIDVVKKLKEKINRELK